MRTFLNSIFLAALVLTAVAHADPIVTLTLDSNNGYGAPTGLNPEPGPPCMAPNCVLFTGTITDYGDPLTDNIGGSGYYSYDLVSVAYTLNSDPTIFSGPLTFDYTAPVGLMSGDPNAGDGDGLTGDGNPQDIYTGPIFGVDIPTGTPDGIYQATVYIDFTNLDTNVTSTLSESVEVILILFGTSTG